MPPFITVCTGHDPTFHSKEGEMAAPEPNPSPPSAWLCTLGVVSFPKSWGRVHSHSVWDRGDTEVTRCCRTVSSNVTWYITPNAYGLTIWSSLEAGTSRGGEGWWTAGRVRLGAYLCHQEIQLSLLPKDHLFKFRKLRGWLYLN